MSATRKRKSLCIKPQEYTCKIIWNYKELPKDIKTKLPRGTQTFARRVILNEERVKRQDAEPLWITLDPTHPIVGPTFESWNVFRWIFKTAKSHPVETKEWEELTWLHRQSDVVFLFISPNNELIAFAIINQVTVGRAKIMSEVYSLTTAKEGDFELSRLSVRPDFRKKGMAKEVMDCVLSKLSTNIRRITQDRLERQSNQGLCCLWLNNATGVFLDEFYKRLFKEYFGEKNIWMKYYESKWTDDSPPFQWIKSW